MALEKNVITLNFSQGLDTKTDPFQVAMGNFLSLENSVFTKGGLLSKRNGFAELPSLPDKSNIYTTTFNGNLLAIGNTLEAFSQGSETWVNKGRIVPVRLQTLPLLRNNTNQSQMDSVVAANGLICTVYTDNIPSGDSTVPSYKYVIADSVTGQNIIAPTVITVGSGTVTDSPRVFLLGKYFIIVFGNIISATPHLQYIAINSINFSVTANTDISALYTNSTSLSFDGVIANNSLYLAWTGAGSTIRMTYIDSTLAQHNTVSTSVANANTMVSVCADTTASTPVIWAAFYDPSSQTGYAMAVNQNLVSILAPTEFVSSTTITCFTLAAQNQIATILYEVANNPDYDTSVPMDYIEEVTVTQSGTVGTPAVMLRGVGLASKAFIINGTIYELLVYNSIFQPTYFLSDSNGNIISKLAYSNGPSSYYATGLPSVTVNSNVAQVAYLFKDLIQAVNKTQGLVNAAGIYSQTGINLATFTVGISEISSAEIGKDLHISGGFLWMYDGFQTVEHNFHLWPDYVEPDPSSFNGAMLAQQYFYVATYEWSDNQGNIFRSAPSIPQEATPGTTTLTFTSTFTSGNLSITVSSAMGLVVGQVITDSTTPSNLAAGTYITSISGTTIGLSQPTAGNSAGMGDTLQTVTTGSVTVYVPTLKLTYKTASPVKIVLYRWSTAQQTYYQTTSLAMPIINDPTVDYIAILDTNPDNLILGNNILYTNGGVLEDIAAPATNVMTLYQSRLWLVDAEDENLLWFSKQVIENTPVEMSDLLTLYVAPTIGAQGSTGGIKALAPMDDKLILFKPDAVYYVSGQGPDNTGANNQFSDPIFITAVVGTSNQESIVFTPNGLMFQSDKGIWLLGRDLSTTYIGAAVEALTQGAAVLSALNIPGTNQVRFTLDNGITLMYDYYYNQWGTFINIPALSSCLYEDLHTYIDSFGRVFQETPGVYLDGAAPVLMSFTTSWIHVAGLEGFQRLYFFYLLGVYQSPHKLRISLAYDYNPSPSQVITVDPDNYSQPYGADTLWGSTPKWGGEPQREQWRIFPKQQKCESIAISFQELFDPTFGTIAGAGLTLSAIDLVVGQKKGYTTLRPSHSAG